VTNNSLEAITMLETTRSTISLWVRAGYLQAWNGHEANEVREYIFDRLYLIGWYSEFVTIPEIKRLLNVTDKTLNKYRKCGQLIASLHD